MLQTNRHSSRPMLIAVVLGLLVAGSAVVATAAPARPRRASRRPSLVAPSRRARPARPLPRRLAPKPTRRVVLAPKSRRVVVRRVGTSVVVVSDSGEQADDMPQPVVITSAGDLTAAPRPDLGGMTAYKVTAVSDDLAVTVRVNGEPKTVGMIGVAAISSDDGDSADPVSARAARNLLIGEFVYIVPDDKPAAQDDQTEKPVYLYRAPDKLLINLEAIRQGFAATANSCSFKHRALFRSYEAKARADGKGIWHGSPHPVDRQASAD